MWLHCLIGNCIPNQSVITWQSGSKAFCPLSATESGITIDFKEQQLENAYSPIRVIDEGIVTDSKEEHPENV